MNYRISIFTLTLGLALLVSCGDSGQEVAQKANEEIINDKDVLSTDLISNPSSDAETIDASGEGKLVWADSIHDFGSLQEGEMVQYEFECTNTGKKEVIITDAKGSCGCTVPSYDGEPIAPGKTAKLTVTFNSKGKPGYNEKSVQVTTSATPAQYKLTILAKVD